MLEDERIIAPSATDIIYELKAPGEVELIEFFGSRNSGGDPSNIEYTLKIDEYTSTFNPHVVNSYINETYAAFFTVKRYQASPPLWLITLAGKIRFSNSFKIEAKNIHPVYSFNLKTRGRILRYRVF